MIKIKNHLFFHGILTIVFCYCISCNDNINKQSPDVSSLSSKESISHSKIKWPDSLVTYNPFNIKLVKGRVLKKCKFKLYAYLNLACSSCIADLNSWANVAPYLKDKGVELIFVCYAKDDFEYFKYLYENKDLKPIPFPFYFDLKFYFQNANSFVKNFQPDQIFLTDQFDNILLQGDMINTKDIYNSMIKKINQTL